MGKFLISQGEKNQEIGLRYEIATAISWILKNLNNDILVAHRVSEDIMFFHLEGKKITLIQAKATDNQISKNLPFTQIQVNILNYITKIQHQIATFDDHKIWVNNLLIISNKSGLAFDKKWKNKHINEKFLLNSIKEPILEEIKSILLALNKDAHIHKLEDISFHFEKITLKEKKKETVNLIIKSYLENGFHLTENESIEIYDFFCSIIKSKSSLEDLEAKNIKELKENTKLIKPKDFNNIVETYKYPLKYKNEILNLILYWYDNTDNFKKSNFKSSLELFVNELSKDEFKDIILQELKTINKDKVFNFKSFIKENRLRDFTDSQDWKKAIIIFDKLTDENLNLRFRISNIKLITIILVASIQLYKKGDDNYEDTV